MKSAFSDKNQLNILVYNSDLPLFPGAGAHEFLNTTQLSQWVNLVGLVSMVHNQQDLLNTALYANQPIKLYLWESPTLQPASIRPKRGLYPIAKRILKKPYFHLIRFIGAQIKKFSQKPVDTFYADRLFRHLTAPLLNALKENYWHAIIIIQSQSAAIIDYIPSSLKTILVMHDIRALVYHRQKNIAQSKWQKRYYAKQAKKYFQFEKNQCKKYDLVIALSEQDAAWIQENYHPKKIAIVPIPVDVHYFHPSTLIKEIPNRLVFTGHMAHPPNVDAAIFFATQVLPLIRAHIPEVEFFIVGKDPLPEIKALEKLPRITVTGTVPDTRPYLATASLIVVPLRFGSGVRNKILEGWSMQKCIISTTIGAEGLNYTIDHHIKIADDADSMAETIIKLLKNPQERAKLSTQGRTIATTYHDPHPIGQHYFKQIDELIVKKNENPMRIAIDIRWMVPGLAGGIENVARSFIQELMHQDHYNHYTLLLNPKSHADFNCRNLENFHTFKETALTLIKKRVHLFRSSLYSKLRIEHLYHPYLLNLRFLRESNIDLVYSFPGYIRPDLYPLSNILMVPDIQHEFLPEFFHEKVLEESRRVYCDSIHNATHLCAISEFTRQTLINKLHISPDNITTILLAADPIFTDVSCNSDQDILRQHDLLSEPFLFFPAHTWHHKNHLAAIKALQILRDKYSLKPLLICTGGQREAEPYIKKFIAETGLQKQVRFLGYCTRETIPALYRKALALIYPSLFEGFGMPVLEAMKSGCPVICSNTTSLPEIAGNAALLVDPTDHEAISEAIYNMMKNEDLRQTLKQEGLKQASFFSWEKHTTETLEVFNTIHKKITGRFTA